jgi:hypothetical protein
MILRSFGRPDATAQEHLTTAEARRVALLIVQDYPRGLGAAHTPTIRAIWPLLSLK